MAKLETGIELYSQQYKVTEILRKTKANGWKDIKVGDIITITTSISQRGRASRGSYAETMTIKNLTQDTNWWDYVNKIAEHLAPDSYCKTFEIEEYEEEEDKDCATCKHKCLYLSQYPCVDCSSQEGFQHYIREVE